MHDHISKGDFLERSAKRLESVMQRAAFAEELARNGAMLQRLDPRAKLVCYLVLIVTIAWSGQLAVLPLFLIGGVILALASRIPLQLILRVWLAVFIFTAMLAAPALFLTPGQDLYRAPSGAIVITVQGATAALRILFRVEAATTYSMLLVLSTPWSHVLKALRVLRVPVILVVILSMTVRYIMLLLDTAIEMLEARRSRRVGLLPPAENRRMIAATAGVLLSKSMELSESVYFAMRSRGYMGEVYIFEDFHFSVADYAVMVGVMPLAAACFWIG